MSPDGEHIDDLLVDYVFGTLAVADDERVARHLDRCPRCAARVQSDRGVAEQLGFAAPRRQPPAELRARLMERVARENTTAPLPAPQVLPAPRIFGGMRPRTPRWALAAALLPWLVVIGLGVAFFMSTHAPPARPTLGVVSLHGAGGETGRLALTPDGTGAFLALTSMPRLRQGQLYACWLERDGAMKLVRTFTLLPGKDDAYVPLRAARPLRSYTAIDITLESAPHPPHPSATSIIAAPLPQ